MVYRCCLIMSRDRLIYEGKKSSARRPHMKSSSSISTSVLQSFAVKECENLRKATDTTQLPQRKYRIPFLSRSVRCGLDSTPAADYSLSASRTGPLFTMPLTKPLQVTTGRRGYLAKLLSVSARWHNRNTDPRSDSMRLAYAQLPHSPAPVPVERCPPEATTSRIAVAEPATKPVILLFLTVSEVSSYPQSRSARMAGPRSFINRSLQMEYYCPPRDR